MKGKDNGVVPYGGQGGAPLLSDGQPGNPEPNIRLSEFPSGPRRVDIDRASGRAKPGMGHGEGSGDNAASLVLIASLLGYKRSKCCCFLMTGTIGIFLLQQALQGWRLPLPVIRRLGVRTAEKISREKTVSYSREKILIPTVLIGSRG